MAAPTTSPFALVSEHNAALDRNLLTMSYEVLEYAAGIVWAASAAQ